MSKQDAGLMSVRISDALRDEFIHSATLNQETPSQALRNAIQKYINETRKLTLHREAAAIRANVEDEADTLSWIAAHGLSNDAD